MLLSKRLCTTHPGTSANLSHNAFRYPRLGEFRAAAAGLRDDRTVARRVAFAVEVRRGDDRSSQHDGVSGPLLVGAGGLFGIAEADWHQQERRRIESERQSGNDYQFAQASGLFTGASASLITPVPPNAGHVGGQG